MAVQALCTPVMRKHRSGSIYPAHIYYYTYHPGNFSQVARKINYRARLLPSPSTLLWRITCLTNGRVVSGTLVLCSDGLSPHVKTIPRFSLLVSPSLTVFLVDDCDIILLSPRSSVDRASASEAGCAGSIPVGDASHVTSSICHPAAAG